MDYSKWEKMEKELEVEEEKEANQTAMENAQRQLPKPGTSGLPGIDMYDLWDIDVDSLDEASLIQNFGVTREELRKIQIKNKKILKVKADAMPVDEAGIEDYVNSMPLFADKLPELDQMEGNPAFSALKDLVEATPPEERAAELKDSGNRAVALARKGEKGRWDDAYEYYRQALAVKGKDNELNSGILSNRALVCYSVANYGKCKVDCKVAMTLNPSNAKAYFHAAKACIALKQLEEALDYAERGVVNSTDNPKQNKILADLVGEIKTTHAKALAKEKAKRVEREAKETYERLQAELLNSIVSKKGIKFGPPVLEMGGENQGHPGYKAKPYVDDDGVTLHWPVLFLYPDEYQTDFFRDAKDTDRVFDMLAMMLPPNADSAPPWDVQNSYTMPTIKVYFEVPRRAKTAKEIKREKKKAAKSKSSSKVEEDQPEKVFVQPSMKLIDVLTTKGYVIPKIPTFFVVKKR